jgi:hypothetical protein
MRVRRLMLVLAMAAGVVAGPTEARAAGGTIALSPSPMQFGNRHVGTTGQLTLTVSATSGTFTVSGTQIFDPDADQFSANDAGCVGQEVAPGDPCFITVSFSPTSRGFKSQATLRVNADEGLGTDTVNLNGTGTAPNAGLTPGSNNFGSQVIGSPTAVFDFQLSNSSPSNEALDYQFSIMGSDANQFELVTATTSPCVIVGLGTLAVDGSCNVGVRFFPTSAGAKSAQLAVATDDPANANPTSTLSGTGTTRDATLLPANHDFGTVVVTQSSASQTFTLTSTGSSAVTVQSVAIGGTNPSEFDINESASTCDELPTLSSTQTCTVDVTFEPTAVGAASATLDVTTDGPDPSSSLTGTGDGPDTAIDSLRVKHTKRKVSVTFSSPTPGVTFECAIDGGPFTVCASPATFKLRRGRHTIQVRAIAGSTADGTPASRSFRIRRT